MSVWSTLSARAARGPLKLSRHVLGDLGPQSCAAPAAPEVPEVGVVYIAGTFGLLPNFYQLMEHVVSLVSSCHSLFMYVV